MTASNEPIRKLLLASTSPRRKELIALLGMPFDVVPSQVDEDTPDSWNVVQVVEGLALRKAQAVYDSLPPGQSEQAIIVGSDTVVVLDGKILGKPADRQEAKDMLESLQGRTHQVYSGVACIRTTDGASQVSHRATSVTMKPLASKVIDAYVRTGEPDDKAGSYAIQGLGATFIERIEGCYFNVVGLPLALLSDLLADLGVHIWIQDLSEHSGE